MKFKKGDKIRIFKDTDKEAYGRWLRDEGYTYSIGSEFITITGKTKYTLDALKLSRTLRLARKRKGITREDLSDAMGVCYDSVFSWEIGRQTPKKNNLEKYCSYVGLNVKDVMEACQIEQE